MSEGTDLLASRMADHEKTVNACTAANYQKSVCDTALETSAQKVAEAIRVVQEEADGLTACAKAPVVLPPNDTPATSGQ
jgi:hypothetical protein